MGIFLDASVLRNKTVNETVKHDIQYNKIRFEFPDGFAELRLIEECRALNALDVSNPDNFDFMFDITMQMLTGKSVFIYFIDDTDKKILLDKFIITDRYMNLRGIDIIDEYPVLVNWLVEFIAGHLAKKFPRSLKDFRVTMSERDEHMKNPKNQKHKDS